VSKAISAWKMRAAQAGQEIPQALARAEKLHDRPPIRHGICNGFPQ
jgi:hypothetical protein